MCRRFRDVRSSNLIVAASHSWSTMIAVIVGGSSLRRAGMLTKAFGKSYVKWAIRDSNP